MEYYSAERNLYLVRQHRGTGEFMLNEISQAVKDKYHMISPITRT